MSDRPLASCVMPTRNRPEAMLQSVRWFLRQDYPSRELIVIDDGFEKIPAEACADPRVRYLRVPPRMTIGAKRDFGVTQARGAIVAQWDDDDWHGPERLSLQVLPILAGEADVTAVVAAFELDLEAWLLRRSAEPDRVHVRSLVFRREVWERAGGYGDTDVDEDRLLLRAALRNGARLRTISGHGTFLYVRHAGAVRRPQDARPPLGSPDLPAEDRELLATRSAALRARAGVRPLVSCIMPTADRRPFVPHAIRRFLEQDYAERELIVADGGRDAVADLIPRDPRVRYLRLPSGHSLGMMRNIACREAGGEWIAHWDDDDWMAQSRLRVQVEALLANDADLCGLRRLYFWNPVRDEAWEYAYPADDGPWVAGGTMLYRRALWRHTPFADVTVGEDNLFVFNAAPKRVHVLEDTSLYVATIHARNTSPKQISSELWQPRPVAEVHAILGADLPAMRELFPAPPAGWREEEAPPPRAPLRITSTPRVSCVLATADRPEFFGQALRCFEGQIYRDAELIVVDSGTSPVERLCTGSPNVRYLRAVPGTSLGMKLNLAIARAAGEIVQKLDDDDYYAPGFLARSVEAVSRADPEHGVTGWDCFAILLAGEPELRFSGHGWIAGGTLAFHRRCWEWLRFRDVSEGEDAAFVADHKALVTRICAPELYVHVRHGRNTWVQTADGSAIDARLRLLPSMGSVAEIVDTANRGFYEALANGRAQPRVTLVAAVLVYDGYGSMSEFLAVGMQRAGATVSLLPLQIDPAGLSAELRYSLRRSYLTERDPILYFSWPGPELESFRSAPELFIFTMWESSRLPADWPARLNDARAVLVPTRFVAQVCRDSGVTCPVETIPLGVDPATYHYVERPEREGLTTLIVGTLINRKHLAEAVAGWKLAFDGDRTARLIVKSRFRTGRYRPDDPRITLIDDSETTRGIAHWYEQADVLIAAGSEGFGLPLVEGMATGLPVVALTSEGQGDTYEDAGPERMLPVPPARWEIADDPPFGRCGVRGVPSPEDIAARLRWVANHRADARAMGRAASEWVLEHRNVWNVGPAVLDAIGRRVRPYVISSPSGAARR